VTFHPLDQGDKAMASPHDPLEQEFAIDPSAMVLAICPLRPDR
jgi:hypothetical protein